MISRPLNGGFSFRRANRDVKSFKLRDEVTFTKLITIEIGRFSVEANCI